MIVRLRYGESAGMLAVISVTANIRVRAGVSADAQAWGQDRQVAGNLVPLSTSFAHEENPTISYTPIDGSKYVRETLSPIPLDLLFLLLETRLEEGQNMLAMAASVNGLRNPAFLRDGEERDKRFPRFAALIVELDAIGAVSWARSSDGEREFALVISRYAPSHTEFVREMLDLVQVSSDAVETGQDVILPMWLSDGTTERQDGLAINTRSIADLLTIAGAAMDLPPEHLESGMVETLPELGPMRDLIRIQRSDAAPERAMVAVQHHGWWYYIDARDPASKETIRLLQILIAFRISESAKTNPQLPVLTVPVSR
jgi:hypothetical protein